MAVAEVPTKKSDPNNRLTYAIFDLFRRDEEIADDRGLLEEVLCVGAEVEGFRGRGSQNAASSFSRSLGHIVYLLKERLPQSEIDPDRFPTADELPPDSEVLASLNLLAAHSFARVQGPKVRSRLAAELRKIAWSQLGLIAEIIPQSRHLDHALKVTADSGASAEERHGAIGFLSDYWDRKDPDVATVAVLDQLSEGLSDHDLLVTVLQTRIDLGLLDEMGAVFAVDDWDNEEEE